MKKMISLALAAILASGTTFGAFAAETEAANDQSLKEVLISIFEEIADMEEGTAGSSLNKAQIAQKLLEFANNYDFSSDENGGENMEFVADAIGALMNMSVEDLIGLGENYDEIEELLDQAVTDYDSVKETFDDAGVKENMDSLLTALSDAAGYWTQVNDSLEIAFDKVGEEIKTADKYLDSSADETEAEPDPMMDDMGNELDAMMNDMETELDTMMNNTETELDAAMKDMEEKTEAAEAEINYGESKIYSEEELKEAADKILEEFNTWGCSDLKLTYAGDDSNREQILAWLNSLSKDKTFTEALGFTSSFHSPEATEKITAWNPDSDYENWEWWLGKTEDGDWVLVTWGY